MKELIDLIETHIGSVVQLALPTGIAIVFSLMIGSPLVISHHRGLETMDEMTDCHNLAKPHEMDACLQNKLDKLKRVYGFGTAYAKNVALPYHGVTID